MKFQILTLVLCLGTSLAFADKYPEIFKTLLAAGADKNLRDSKGKRAVDYFKEELSFLRYEPEFKEEARKTLKMLK